MRSALVVLTIAGASSAPTNEFTNLANVVNSANAGWHAEAPTRFDNFDQVKILCGGLDDGRVLTTRPPLDDATDLPVDFDSRATWSNCSIIGKVGDQSGCGDCWAFSATQILESYLCIKGDLPGNVELSKLDAASCCSGSLCGFSKSCTAGTPFSAMLWMTINGVVTGGAFNSSEGCEPYSLAPCSVDPTDPKDPLPACHEPKPPPTLACSSTCSNPTFKTSYASDKRGANMGFTPQGLSYRDDNQTHAMKYITENGPLSATFTVMEDFPTYRGGIYKHVTGKALGGHAILIVGFGTENGTDYWTVKNSWSSYWGDNGYFRIVRGVDEVGIESHMSGWVKSHEEE
jgi:cathepsin B